MPSFSTLPQELRVTILSLAIYDTESTIEMHLAGSYEYGFERCFNKHIESTFDLTKVNRSMNEDVCLAIEDVLRSLRHDKRQVAKVWMRAANRTRLSPLRLSDYETNYGPLPRKLNVIDASILCWTNVKARAMLQLDLAYRIDRGQYPQLHLGATSINLRRLPHGYRHYLWSISDKLRANLPQSATVPTGKGPRRRNRRRRRDHATSK